MYKYLIVYREIKGSSVRWVAIDAKMKKKRGNLLPLLEKLSKDGWETVATGEFVSGSHSEILLRRPA